MNIIKIFLYQCLDIACALPKNCDKVHFTKPAFSGSVFLFCLPVSKVVLENWKYNEDKKESMESKLKKSEEQKYYAGEREDFVLTHTMLLSLSMAPPLLIPLLYAFYIGKRSTLNPYL